MKNNSVNENQNSSGQAVESPIDAQQRSLQPTERPWTIQQLNHADNELWLQIGFFDGDREIGPICEMVGGAVKMYRPVAEFQHLVAPDAEVRANAELIVRAVNAHDELIRVLTLIRDRATKVSGGYYKHSYQEQCLQIAELAQTTLALATKPDSGARNAG